MLSDLFKVQIDFDRSHLVFPAIVEWLLIVFALAIVVQRRALIRATLGRVFTRLAPASWRFDQARLFGTLALTVAYFLAMEPVGRVLPNTGIGFVICSIVFFLALARLLVHDITPRKWLSIGLASFIGPLLVWYVFSEIFRVTLP
ncbi:MAG TPA: tripartite tricarboxylate transporter TctB family protein [Hydrogenophaga sp.]|nr:tripartite tricarboxylate transporter TctB family protein [Hydrogenophaga sp.]